MNKFKKYGRILIGKLDDAGKIISIMKDLDKDVLNTCPNGLITTVDQLPGLVETKDFAIDMAELQKRCDSDGITMHWITSDSEKVTDNEISRSLRANG